MNTLTAPWYVFRPGALDHIKHTRKLQTEAQLAAAIGITLEDLGKVRDGAPVTTELALKVATLQGDENYLGGYFDPYLPQAA